MTEKRKINRYPTNLHIRMRPFYDNPKKAHPRWRRFLVLNAGSGGLFLKTRKKFAKGDMVELELPLENEKISAKGRVVWISKQAPSGVGIRFSRLSPAVRKQIEQEILASRWLVNQYTDQQKDIFVSDISDIL